VKDLIVPTGFAAVTARREGEAGRRWLETLPALATRYCREWDVRLDGEPMHGYIGVVVPAVRADGTPVVLKLTWLDTESSGEPLALSTWNGQGAVRLLESDPARGAMLLERLDSGRILRDEPIDYAVEIAGGLMRRLAVPAPPELGRDLRTEAARLVDALPRRWRELGQPFPRYLVDAAVDVCRKSGPTSGDLLVNEDLHYENVLGGTREPWLVIDPKPLAADLEFGVLSLMWNRVEESTPDARMAAIVAAAGLDAELAVGWALVRAVRSWLNAIEEGEPTEDPAALFAPRLAHWAYQAARAID
jgi:streptomycin 6-kinase